jgi:2-polyprenyl-6-methoxyphenol hydroxylase-like FAD-dependent oxidoreductase
MGSEAMTKTVDVIIGGGGMVGLALGIALAKGGLEVVVADPVPEAEALGAGFDGRVSALAFASVRMFKALGIWGVLAEHAQPIDDILVTDAKLGRAPSPFSLHFDHRELGQPLGYIAENRHIRQALFAACCSRSRCERRRGKSGERHAHAGAFGGRGRRPRFADPRLDGHRRGELVLSASGHRGDRPSQPSAPRRRL